MNNKRLCSFLSDKRFIILAISCLLCGFLNIFDSWMTHFKNPPQFLLLLIPFVILVTFIFVYVKNIKVDERVIIFLIFAIGFIFRLVYIQSTGYLSRQHDVSGSNGHYEYIMKFYNHQKLPETVEWQYYQPPVWHYICALFLHIQTAAGVAIEAARENLQLITLFCSSAIMFISHRLFRQFGLKDTPLVIACAIIAFHPTFIILSGSINNDVLSLTLALLSCTLAIKWYREPKLKTILLLALSIGFSMGVKLSGGLISVGVAMLFAIKLFGKEYKNKLGLIGQYSLFGVLCVPIALWWQVRNLLLYNIPLTYIPKLSETNSQYIGFRSFFERIFDISSIWDAGVYPARAIKSKLGIFDYYEYNIPAAVLKTSVFGEYYLGFTSPIGRFFAVLLFYSAAILAIISVVSAVVLLVRRIKERKNDCEFKLSELIFTLVCSVTVIFSYTKFCFDFAHFCTMDFRYIAITVVFGALYVGLLLKQNQKNNKMFDKVLVNTLIVLTIIFAISSLALYSTAA